MFSKYLIAAFAALLSTAAAQEASCDIYGYDTGTNPAFLATVDPALATLEACGNMCSTTRTCASFAFGADTCLLYNVPVEGNVNPMVTSPYNFNDLACVGTTPPPEGETPPEGGATRRRSAKMLA
ncbi:hypothetical protein AJ79_05364 [Helicocarpus griseus UAMH5409]|uniref:Apple domain-containing protein n=1 Tax=Helicocarpus griseus UAMH5409 TaxID=1447875 RepID=A0A2B7XNZ2_9EURO|nr:hypothetical protein AJ79_05364 [Helicocarpus griseus UAMH5409]